MKNTFLLMIISCLILLLAFGTIVLVIGSELPNGCDAHIWNPFHLLYVLLWGC